MNNAFLTSTTSALLIAVLLSILCTVLSCRWYYRGKLKYANRKFNQTINEQKDIAWRARMNPHFVHNCLNSINSFIHMQDKQSAANYLTCFSRLMRKVLEHSGDAKISLSLELDALKDYIDLELLRFGREINVRIQIDDQLNPEQVYVPPLFIQPFLENALIHGLLPKQGEGSVCICLEARGDLLYCGITDDGIGRPAENHENNGTHKRSLGIAITQKRISAFNAAHEVPDPVSISDLIDEQGNGIGTKVEVQLALVERF